jgi:hypothetical protein
VQASNLALMRFPLIEEFAHGIAAQSDRPSENAQLSVVVGKRVSPAQTTQLQSVLESSQKSIGVRQG